MSIFSLVLLLISLFRPIHVSIVSVSAVISITLIIVPLIILSESSYFYPRIGYGYFANVNNALRFTHSLGKPLVIDNFTNIVTKNPPGLVVKPANNHYNNQLNYVNGESPYLAVLGPMLPKALNLDEHRSASHYESKNLPQKRRGLNEAFHKHYAVDPKIISITSKYDDAFKKGAIGAHIRFIGHYTTSPKSDGPDLNFENQIKAYTDYIDKSEYERVYLATHLKEVEKIFRKKYGHRLIIYEHYRNPDKNSDWTSNNLAQVEEDTNVLIDMILLSKCAEIVGGPSNVFYASLWYNPDLKFHIPDILKTTVCG